MYLGRSPLILKNIEVLGGEALLISGLLLVLIVQLKEGAFEFDGPVVYGGRGVPQEQSLMFGLRGPEE